MKVLVAGATGYLGSRIVVELKSRGHEVHSLVRSPHKLETLGIETDHVVVADAAHPDALHGCCEGIDVLVSTIGIVGKSGKATVWDVDYDANLNLLKEAVSAGVGRFVYTSVVRAPAIDGVEMVKAKRAFERELVASPMAHTIVYPNGYFSDMDAFLKMAAGGRAYVFGNGQRQINPVDGADVARAVADAMEAGIAEVEIGGPNVLTHDQVATLAFQAIGRHPKIIHIPNWAATSVRAIARRLTPLRVHASLDFLLTVLTADMVAPTVGTTTLAEHFATAVAQRRT